MQIIRRKAYARAGLGTYPDEQTFCELKTAMSVVGCNVIKPIF